MGYGMEDPKILARAGYAVDTTVSGSAPLVVQTRDTRNMNAGLGKDALPVRIQDALLVLSMLTAAPDGVDRLLVEDDRAVLNFTIMDRNEDEMITVAEFRAYARSVGALGWSYTKDAFTNDGRWFPPRYRLRTPDELCDMLLERASTDEESALYKAEFANEDEPCIRFEQFNGELSLKLV